VGDPAGPDWSNRIDHVVLARLVDYGSTHRNRVDSVCLTRSYVRGAANPARPNVNFIARPGHTRTVRAEVGRGNEIAISEVDLSGFVMLRRDRSARRSSW
jgi:hypothetical protein